MGEILDSIEDSVLAQPKWCSKCKNTKPLRDFHKSKSMSDGFTKYCKACNSDVKRLHYYGITKESYEDLLADQGQACAICRVPTGELRLPLAVDHDHTCCPGRRSCGECVRGLICDSCNRGVGFLGDSYQRLIAAARYIRRSTPKRSSTRPSGKRPPTRGLK